MHSACTERVSHLDVMSPGGKLKLFDIHPTERLGPEYFVDRNVANVSPFA